MNLSTAKLGIVLAAAIGLFAGASRAADDSAWQLQRDVQVDSSGIFLNQVVVPPNSLVLPQLRLAPAPTLGQTATFTRQQISELVQKVASGLTTTNWSGATQVRVSRRTRQFSDVDITKLLTETLQRDYVKDRGELELHLGRPWTPVLVPDEPLTLKISDVPATGVNPYFMIRCELWNNDERVGAWQLVVQSKLWRDIPVAHTLLNRGTLVHDADIDLERRDVLSLRDVFTGYPTDDNTLELAENIQEGMPIMNRSVRPRPVIRRGRVVEAVYQDGSLSISLKVEAMEDGLLGQTVRVRNPRTRRELIGKVQNEQTVLIIL